MKQFLEAVSTGNTLLVKKILKNSIDLSCTDINRGLLLSCQKGYGEITQILMQNSKQVSEPVLQNMIKNRYSKSLKYIIQESTNIPVHRLLKYAVNHGSHASMIKILLKEIPRQELRENQELIFVVLKFMCKYFHNGFIIQDFAKRQTVDSFSENITIKQESVLKSLLKTTRKRNLLKYLLSKRKVENVHFEEEYLFRKACKVGDIELVRILITLYNVDVNARNSEGRKYALKYGFTDIVKIIETISPTFW
jgi:hypothetical protein